MYINMHIYIYTDSSSCMRPWSSQTRTSAALGFPGRALSWESSPSRHSWREASLGSSP